MSESGLRLEVDSWLAEVGGLFTGLLANDPPPDQASSVRAVRLELWYWTEGRGTKDRRTVSELHYPASDGVQLATRFTLPVPWEVPISYDGDMIRVRWQIRAVVNRSWKTDHSTGVDVVVAPVGGFGLYHAPHPLRSQGSVAAPPPPGHPSEPSYLPPPPGAPAPQVPPPEPTDGPTPPRPSPWG
jgi:hypothetical protein